MAFFTLNYKDEEIKDYTGEQSKYINTSGIYEVIIRSVIVDTTKNGSDVLNFWLDYKGQEQPIFQAIRMTNNDGSENKIGHEAFRNFLIVCGAKKGEAIEDPVKFMVPIGKEGLPVECMVLKQFENIPMFIRIQIEYGLYEGKIQQRKYVRQFFRYEDKATASEIVNETAPGKQYEIEMEYADKITYKDDLTEEDVKEWIKNRSSGKKEATANKPSTGFGTRRFGKG